MNIDMDMNKDVIYYKNEINRHKKIINELKIKIQKYEEYILDNIQIQKKQNSKNLYIPEIELN
jgi:hypothetical protein